MKVLLLVLLFITFITTGCNDSDSASAGSSASGDVQDPQPILPGDEGFCDEQCQFKEDLLSKHNQLREMVSNGEIEGLPVSTNQLPELEWDENLATVAANFIQNCGSGHDDQRTELTRQLGSDYSYVGENIFITTNINDSNQVYTDGIQSWFDEHQNYNYNNISCEGGVCGHFTQVIWENTTKVGCAKIICQGIEDSTNGPSALLVCNYGEGGNYANQNPYSSEGNIGPQTPPPVEENDEFDMVWENGHFIASDLIFDDKKILVEGDLIIEEHGEVLFRGCKLEVEGDLILERNSVTLFEECDIEINGKLKIQDTAISEFNGSYMDVSGRIEIKDDAEVSFEGVELYLTNVLKISNRSEVYIYGSLFEIVSPNPADKSKIDHQARVEITDSELTGNTQGGHTLEIKRNAYLGLTDTYHDFNLVIKNDATVFYGDDN
ncbi:MAG: CAP domain-containing protein [Bacteriovoracaceae bacterium]|jgi:pathogenesis-related protein 1|nr:CAP domain-containing protein [Bacteriovoracaceae bacterium]